jgi:hypothetical protein
MTAGVWIFLASASVVIAGVAVAVAICSWAHTPGRIIPGWRKR